MHVSLRQGSVVPGSPAPPPSRLRPAAEAAPRAPSAPAPQPRPRSARHIHWRTPAIGARRTESHCGVLVEDTSPRSGAARQPPLSSRPGLPGLTGQLCGSSEKLCCTLSLISLAALTCKLLVAPKPGWISLEHFPGLVVTQRMPSVHSTSSSGGDASARPPADAALLNSP